MNPYLKCLDQTVISMYGGQERYSSECKTQGGSVVVWGSTEASAVGELLKINGIMRTEKYRQILIYREKPSGEHLIVDGFSFHHDSDPNTRPVQQSLEFDYYIFALYTVFPSMCRCPYFPLF